MGHSEDTCEALPEGFSSSLRRKLMWDQSRTRSNVLHQVLFLQILKLDENIRTAV